MFSRGPKLGFLFYVISVGISVSARTFGASAVVGMVAGSTNATVGGQVLLPNTAIFSGDSLRVRDGVAVIAVGRMSRMAFGPNTLVSFLRDSDQVTVLLGQGNVSLYHPQESVSLRVKIGDVSIAPAQGFKTLGDVAIVGGTIVVNAKEGMLRIEGYGSAIDVAKGKTVTVAVKTAKAPTGSASAPQISGHLALQIASAVAAGTGAALGGAAMLRASDASDAAKAAGQTAALAVAAGNAATTAAKNAVGAAQTALATAVAAGCAVAKTFPPSPVSPFTPPQGFTCP